MGKRKSYIFDCCCSVRNSGTRGGDVFRAGFKLDSSVVDKDDWRVSMIQITESERERYTLRLKEHITYVQEAGKRLNVDPQQLANHDLSKWLAIEFDAYAKYFCSDTDISPVDAPSVSDDFARAWLHHIHNNPHHWQYWIFPDNYSPKNSSLENGVMEMPYIYALEMVADWMGASKAYTGSWDMTDWFVKNAPRIRVHSKTAILLTDILTCVNMSDVIHPDTVDARLFGSALK